VKRGRILLNQRFQALFPLIPNCINLPLGTPVFSDITFGDKINPANNQWTDNNGKLQSFEPMTFYTVLLSVSRAKKIVKTEIQGRNGTVKEYIGDDDAAVEITGMICGTNGHYPLR
jgi:hypothetical protein